MTLMTFQTFPGIPLNLRKMRTAMNWITKDPKMIRTNESLMTQGPSIMRNNQQKEFEVNKGQTKLLMFRTLAFIPSEFYAILFKNKLFFPHLRKFLARYEIKPNYSTCRDSCQEIVSVLYGHVTVVLGLVMPILGLQAEIDKTYPELFYIYLLLCSILYLIFVQIDLMYLK